MIRYLIETRSWRARALHPLDGTPNNFKCMLTIFEMKPYTELEPNIQIKNSHIIIFKRYTGPCLDIVEATVTVDKTHENAPTAKLVCLWKSCQWNAPVMEVLTMCFTLVFPPPDHTDMDLMPFNRFYTGLLTYIINPPVWIWFEPYTAKILDQLLQNSLWVVSLATSHWVVHNNYSF